VVAKVEHHRGELFPRVGFIVTNLGLPSPAVARFYNKRGTAEQWIKEGKRAVKMTRRQADHARRYLLAAVSGRASDAAGVRGDSAEDLGQ